ncbi:MFS transporter [Desulforamulus ferrireducens]|uniref:MFS transporter n=1 Tax=Desulforamulus ferrireducens TaxID=1833852 RepID=UPI001EE4E234|nr:MFS transporter [Desulforamulus ferrireducens]
MALILVATDMLTLMLTTSIFNIGTSLMGPSTSTLVSKNASGTQGASIGLMRSFGSLGRIVGPVAGGVLYDIHMDIPYMTGAVTLLVLAILSLYLLERYEKPLTRHAKPATD